MKKIIYIASSVVVLSFLWSCKDEDSIRIPDNLTGANMRIIVDPLHRQINYQTVATDFFAFDAYSENTDINTVEFTATYNGQTKSIGTFHQADFTDDGKVRVELHASDFGTLFGNAGFVDGSSGGNFIIKPKVILNDGRIYPAYVHLSATDSILNVATSIIGSSGAQGAFTLQVITAITCPPLNIAGNYSVISASGMSTDGCCPEATTISGNTVVLTALDATTFSITDITGGLYLEWYDVYGITSTDDTPGTLMYNCQEVGIINTAEPFGSTIQGSGSYDPGTGRIVYTWFNGFGDQATVTLQKQ